MECGRLRKLTRKRTRPGTRTTEDVCEPKRKIYRKADRTFETQCEQAMLFPDEIILHIVMELTDHPSTIASLSLACRCFNRIASSNEVWREAYIRRWKPTRMLLSSMDGLRGRNGQWLRHFAKNHKAYMDKIEAGRKCEDPIEGEYATMQWAVSRELLAPVEERLGLVASGYNSSNCRPRPKVLKVMGRKKKAGGEAWWTKKGRSLLKIAFKRDNPECVALLTQVNLPGMEHRTWLNPLFLPMTVINYLLRRAVDNGSEWGVGLVLDWWKGAKWHGGVPTDPKTCLDIASYAAWKGNALAVRECLSHDAMPRCKSLTWVCAGCGPLTDKRKEILDLMKTHFSQDMKRVVPVCDDVSVHLRLDNGYHSVFTAALRGGWMDTVNYISADLQCDRVLALMAIWLRIDRLNDLPIASLVWLRERLDGIPRFQSFMGVIDERLSGGE